MATYGLKYSQYLEQGGVRLQIKVYVKDYSGASYGMAHITGASLQIVGGQSDVLSPVLKTAFSWSMADCWDEGTTRADGTTCVDATGQKCGKWEEFYTNDATKFKVELSVLPDGGTASVIWTGFVTQDSWSESLVYRGSVTITARDMLGALQDTEFNLTGRVSVLDIVQGALSACACQMALSYTAGHFLVNSNGSDILAHTVAASTFSGDNWQTVLENVLESLGLVLRYNGANSIVLTSYRYIKADTLRGTHGCEFISRSGLRSLNPALKEITETFDVDVVEVATPDPPAGQFAETGSNLTQKVVAQLSGGGKQTSTNYIPGYTLALSGDEGWSGSLGIPALGTPKGGAPDRGIYFPTDIEEAAEASLTLPRMRGYFALKIEQDGGLVEIAGRAGALVIRPCTSGHSVSEVRVRVEAVVDGVTKYLTASGSWDTASADFGVAIGQEIIVPDSGAVGAKVVIVKVITENTMPAYFAILAALRVAISPGADGASIISEYKTTTIYNEGNNVTISRSPKIGSAGIGGCVDFYENVLSLGDSVAPDEWNWGGESSYYPLAVMIHAQILVYNAAAASVFTGTMHDTTAGRAAALPGYGINYYQRDCVPVNATYDFVSGFVGQTTLREVYTWAQVWGSSFNPQYTRKSGSGRGSTSAAGAGGASVNPGSGSSVNPGGGGTNYWEIGGIDTMLQPKGAYDYISAKDGLFFAGASLTGTPVPDLYVDVVQDSGGNDVRVLRSPLALITEGDQIVGDGTPGQGGGGGMPFMRDIQDVSLSVTVGNGDLLQWNGSAWVNVAANTVGVTTPASASAPGLMSSADYSKLAGIANGATNVTESTVSGWGFTKNAGTVTSVKVGSTPYSPSSGVVSLPAYPTDYWKTGDSRTANTVLAAPNGSNGAASFRALVAADIPNLAISKITNLQSALDGKQATISDLETIRSNATNGQAAYSALGNYVLKAGDTMTGDLIIEKTGGGLTIRGERLNANADGGYIYLAARYYNNERNGVKIAAVYPGSGLYDIQDLVFYSSDNRSGDASPIWEESMRIKSTKAVSIAASLAIGTTLSVSGLATLSGGATIPVNKKLTIGDAEIEWIPNSGNGYLRINKPLLTVGDQIVNSGTPGGGGGGGGAGFLYELGDVLTDSGHTVVKQYNGTDNAANNNLFAFNGSKWYALKLGSNLAISSGTLNATDTTYSNGTGLDLSNGVFSITTAYQTKIDNGASAYSTLTTSQAKNKVLASPSNASGAPSFRALVAADIPSLTVSKITDIASNYVSIATANTITAKHTFSNGILLNTASSWSNTDRALYFSASDEMANISYYSTDASKGLTFNPYSGALKAGSFVKLGGGSGFLKADGSEDTTAYLPLSGGTMTGSIKLPNGSYINAESGLTMCGIGSGGETFYCGPGAEITNAFYIRSGNIDLTHVKAGQNYKIWDASNSNLSTVDWAANNLTVAGTSTFSDTMYVENRKYMQWKDSGGTYRNIFGLNNTNELLIGYGLSSVTGSVVAIYGETVRLNTGMTELVQANGATLMLAGTGVNTGGSKILFRSSNTSDQNGFKIEAEAAASSSNRGRLALNFFTSNNTTSPYAPDWKRAMRISYNGNIMFGNTASGSEFYPTVYSYGPLQVGTSNTNKNLTVYGSITSSGDQVISSDASLKKNWRDLKYGVADIAKATAGVFDWMDGKGESAGTKAQDWMHLVPQLVHGEEGHMTLAYGQIAMLNTILLARRSEDHETRIKALELENAELRKEIERLRS